VVEPSKPFDRVGSTIPLLLEERGFGGEKPFLLELT